MGESGALFFVLMAGLAGSMALVYVPPVSYTHLTLPTIVCV